MFVFDQNFQLLYLIPRDLLWRWAYKTKIIVLIVLVKCLITSKAHWNCCLAFANGSVSNKNWLLLQNKKKMKINIRERLGCFFFNFKSLWLCICGYQIHVLCLYFILKKIFKIWPFYTLINVFILSRKMVKIYPFFHKLVILYVLQIQTLIKVLNLQISRLIWCGLETFSWNGIITVF